VCIYKLGRSFGCDKEYADKIKKGLFLKTDCSEANNVVARLG